MAMQGSGWRRSGAVRSSLQGRILNGLTMVLGTWVILSGSAVRASVEPVSQQQSVESASSRKGRASALSLDSWYLDALASWGVSDGTEVASQGSPTMNQMGLTVTAAWQLSPRFFVGISNDLRSAAQYSDVLSSVGEVSGYRTNWLAPTIGLVWNDFVVKFDAQWLGDYRVAAPAGSQVLSRPRGWRLSALYPVLRNLHAGAQIESVEFSLRSRNGGEAETLRQPTAIWQAALTAGLVF